MTSNCKGYTGMNYGVTGKKGFDGKFLEPEIELCQKCTKEFWEYVIARESWSAAAHTCSECYKKLGKIAKERFPNCLDGEWPEDED